MRVFVAVNPSSEERARLGAATRTLREAGFPIRWVSPDNVHLTLKFLGEVGEERVSEVSAAIEKAAAGSGALEMAVGGFGAFPSLRRPSVVWVGIESSAALQNLQERVEGALADLDFPREGRAFRPHLTIGRAKKRARPSEFRGLDDALNGLEYEDVYQVRAVEVMRSRLMPSGAIYDVVQTVEL
jgi:2'-5' RNA ligase